MKLTSDGNIDDDYITDFWDGRYFLDDELVAGDIDDDVVERREDGLFHIGQSYERKPCETLYCKRCGGNRFFVGKGKYYTGIKCTTCDWEKCIHDG